MSDFKSLDEQQAWIAGLVVGDRVGERASVETIQAMLTAFNDNRTHADILALLDRAIEGIAA